MIAKKYSKLAFLFSIVYEKVIVFNKIQKNGYFFSDSCDTVKKDQFFQSRVQTVTFLRLQFTHHMYSGNDHACMRN